MNSPEMLKDALNDAQALRSIVFPNPWAARAFGLTLAAVEKNLFSLQAFQHALIERIAESESRGESITDEERYYSCWVDALTVLLDGTPQISLASRDEEERKIREYTHQAHLHQEAHFPPRPLLIVEGK
ncbi:nitrile hydratase accessory protein [Sodalis ligni]|uniref:Nitrile hydratase accessory protein n=1 Tax=Sodalis ligni TaxID=2697027 RepID=A0A4R1N4E6_9GAMM|nr:nitrile hydratase accessory protein [Sodalis ligni]TCL02034.1 nitrile hydratase accessory protein [Sodalis ligni]